MYQSVPHCGRETMMRIVLWVNFSSWGVKKANESNWLFKKYDLITMYTYLVQNDGAMFYS